jgi:membrane-associated phospholipid phosphatase
MSPLRVPRSPAWRRPRPRWVGLGAVLCLGLTTSQVGGAQAASSAASSISSRSSVDTSLVRPAPIVTRGDLKGAAIGVGLTALAVPADGWVRSSVRRPEWQVLEGIQQMARAGNLWGDPGVLTLSTGMWIGGRVTGHPHVAQVGLRAFETIGVSGVITRVLKASIGRARPNHPPYEVWDVELGRGWDSIQGDGAYEALPSGHATAAFAFASAVSNEVARIAPEHARTIRLTTYGLATWTAYARVHTDAHWLSDVVLGAAVGTVTGWAVTRWHATRPGNVIDRYLLGETVVTPLVTPAPFGGTRVGVSLTWP